MSKRDRETEIPRDGEGGREGQGRRGGLRPRFVVRILIGPVVYTERASGRVGKAQNRALAVFGKPRSGKHRQRCRRHAVPYGSPVLVLRRDAGSCEIRKSKHARNDGTKLFAFVRAIFKPVTPRISRPFKAQIARVNSLYYRRLEVNVLLNIVLLVRA